MRTTKLSQEASLRVFTFAASDALIEVTAGTHFSMLTFSTPKACPSVCSCLTRYCSCEAWSKFIRCDLHLC